MFIERMQRYTGLLLPRILTRGTRNKTTDASKLNKSVKEQPMASAVLIIDHSHGFSFVVVTLLFC